MTYISRSEFDRAVLHVRGTGVPATLEAKLASPQGGRPRAMSVEVLLAGMLLSSIHNQNVRHTSVYSVLNGLAGNVRRHYGIQDLQVSQVRYLSTAITNLYEHTPLRRPLMKTGERHRRREALQALVDDLVGHTVKDIPSTGAYAIDATAIDTPARRRYNREKFNDVVHKIHAHKPLYDVDARIGHRTRTHANRTDFVYGYQLLAMTRIPLDNSAHGVPNLIDRIALVPGNEGALPETMQALDSLTATGTTVCEIVVDKGFSQSDYEDFRGPLNERNIDVVLDLKSGDHRVVPHEKDGYIVLDGELYCATLPDRLRVIHLAENLWAKNPQGRTHVTEEEQHDWDERVAARKQFEQLITERNAYRLESKGRAKNGKGGRYICPITTGRLGHETHPPKHRRKTCCTRSLTIPDSMLGKHRQKHIWGTRKWFESFARRTAVPCASG